MYRNDSAHRLAGNSVDRSKVVQLAGESVTQEKAVGLKGAEIEEKTLRCAERRAMIRREGKNQAVPVGKTDLGSGWKVGTRRREWLVMGSGKVKIPR